MARGRPRGRPRGKGTSSGRRELQIDALDSCSMEEDEHTSSSASISSQNGPQHRRHGEPRDVVQDEIGSGSNPLTPRSDAPSGERKWLKRGRGPSGCMTLENKVKQWGKIRIVFSPGEKIPMENDGDFSRGVGFLVKTGARLTGVRKWKDIPDEEKKILFSRLDEYFFIEDQGNPHVKACINDTFQTQYRRWRSRLSTVYKELVASGQNPRERSPRIEVPLNEWLGVCNLIEGEEFQKLSKINSANRSSVPYPSNAGSRPLSRQKKTPIPKKIENRAGTRTHKDGGGEFVNEEAQLTYDRMVQMEEQEEGCLNPNSQDKIMGSALGKSGGYMTEMGRGVMPPQEDATSESNSQVRSMKDRLAKTEFELQSTKNELRSVKEEIQTTKNELQTTKGELQTTKDELQRTKDELGSVKDELHFSKEQIGNLTVNVQEIRHWFMNMQSIWPRLRH